jgi:hypothetical protein
MNAKELEATVNEVVKDLNIEDFLKKNGKEIYEKLLSAMAIGLDLKCLINCLRNDVNQITCNYDVVSPKKLKEVTDKIIEARYDKSDENISKAADVVIISIALFVFNTKYEAFMSFIADSF